MTGYYKRFIAGYWLIAKPLTDMLKRDAFVWSPIAEVAFSRLKEAMYTAPVLALPKFSLPFTVETDACDSGVGAVLLQQGKPIVFISKGLNGQHLLLSTYEKELLAILLDVDKWRHYLEPNHFLIKTDHQSLKYLLE